MKPRIPSYETPQHQDGSPAEALAKTSVADLVNERLRALGYVGDSDQSSPEIHFTVARKLMEKKEWKNAERELLEAIRLRPDQVEFHEALARLEPANDDAWLQAGLIAAASDQPEQAVPFLLKARTLDPDRFARDMETNVAAAGLVKENEIGTGTADHDG